MFKLLAGIFMVIGVCSWTLADVSECVGKCPPYSSVDSPVYFLPHENCNMYCVCNFGKPIEMPCPPGLHFGPNFNTCVDPTIAECANYHPELSMTTGQVEETNDLIFVDNCIGECTGQEDSNEIILLAHVNSQMYCHCKNGRPIVKNCKEGHLFNTEEGLCIPKNVKNYL